MSNAIALCYQSLGRDFRNTKYCKQNEMRILVMDEKRKTLIKNNSKVLSISFWESPE